MIILRPARQLLQTGLAGQTTAKTGRILPVSVYSLLQATPLTGISVYLLRFPQSSARAAAGLLADDRRHSNLLPAVRAADFPDLQNVPTISTGGGLCVSQRSAASDTACLAYGICYPAVAAYHSPQPLRKLMTRSGSLRRAVDLAPHPIHELQVLHILRKVIQSSQKGPGISERLKCCGAERGRRAKPLLLSHPDHYAVGRLLEGHGNAGVSTRMRARSRGDLHGYAVCLLQHLCAQAAPVELGYQGLGQIRGLHVPVQESLLHLFDYNREAIFPFQSIYDMRRFWFHLTMCMGIAASMLGLGLALRTSGRVLAQSAASDTPQPGSGSAYITQTYSEAINVRTGPSTVYYPVIGHMPIGATAPAIAASPSREWIEISYPGGPGGVGWVYAANVTLTGSLQVVEPPPTEAPLETATIDPTLAAAFSAAPTETRLPTFTPPPPLSIPVFPDSGASSLHFPMGWAIGLIALVGAGALGVSFFGRR
jgi:hypothetical protein